MGGESSSCFEHPSLDGAWLFMFMYRLIPVGSRRGSELPMRQEGPALGMTGVEVLWQRQVCRGGILDPAVTWE